MPNNGLVDDEPNELEFAPEAAQNEEQLKIARKRLAKEARQALAFGGNGTRDVTEGFTVAAKQLRPGQLVKDGYFTLFEAVGALEIMDPKMDSGYVPEGDTFEPTFDVCQGLSPEQTLWIMDEIFRLEIAWLEGYPLSQTVFTSLHVDRILSPDNSPPYTFKYGEYPLRKMSTEDSLVHTVMRAYCVAIAKCWQYVLGVVVSQNFYEEEDFVTHQFGRDFVPKTSCNEAEQLLKQASEWLEKTEISSEIRDALEMRLQFRRDLLASLDSNTDQWSACVAAVETIKDTHRLGEPVPDAFSDKVQRQLATSTPPRPMLDLSWEDACKDWTKMCSDTIEANRLTSIEVITSPQSLQRATWAFTYRNPQPNTFARAHMQNILFGNERISDEVSHFELFLADIRDVVLAGDVLVDPESFQVEMPSDPRHIGSRILEAFMEKAFDEYLNLYRMVCQNRCRIRRTFTQTVPILDEMESEALRMDEELHDAVPQRILKNPQGQLIRLNPMSSWTKYHKLRIVMWTIQLGFETEIYLPDELGSMYQVLIMAANAQAELLMHIGRFLMDRMKTLTQRRQTNEVAECLATEDWLKSQLARIEITRSVSVALWRLYTMLGATKIIKTPKREYADEKLLFDARMKPFFGLNHDPMPTAEDLRLGRIHTSSVSSSCQSISEDLKEAKLRLAELKEMDPQQSRFIGTETEWKREIKQLETTSVAIAVQTSQILRICEKQGKKNAKEDDDLSKLMEVSIPAPGARYHDWWVVPQIKERK